LKHFVTTALFVFTILFTLCADLAAEARLTLLPGTFLQISDDFEIPYPSESHNFSPHNFSFQNIYSSQFSWPFYQTPGSESFASLQEINALVFSKSENNAADEAMLKNFEADDKKPMESDSDTTEDKPEENDEKEPASSAEDVDYKHFGTFDLSLFTNRYFSYQVLPDSVKLMAYYLPDNCEWLRFDSSDYVLTGEPALADTGLWPFSIYYQLNSALVFDTLLIQIQVRPDPLRQLLSLFPDTLSWPEDEKFFLPFAIKSPALDSISWFIETADSLIYSALANDTLILSAKKDWFGKDTLTIGASDGDFSISRTLHFVVTPVNDPPQWLSAQQEQFISTEPDTLMLEFFDIDTPEDSLQITMNWENDSLHILLEKNALIALADSAFRGPARLQLILSDGEFSDTNTVLYTKAKMNHAPQMIAVADTSIFEDDTLKLSLLWSDPDGDSVSVSIQADAPIRCHADDSMCYFTPAPDWSGNALVHIHISDGTFTDSLSFQITVIAVNDAPTAPVLLKPDHDFYQIMNIEDLNDTLAFQWEPSSDADDDSLFYIFQLFSEKDTLFQRELAESHLAVPLVSLISYTDSLSALNLFWNVIATDTNLFILSENGPFNLTIDMSSVALDNSELPQQFSLRQNYPNPFNGVTTIEYGLPEKAHVTLTIYSLLGNYINTLVNTEQAPGWQQIFWDGTDIQRAPVSAGVYFCRISAQYDTDTHIKTIKMVHMK
jgi:hypothetical protein